MMFSDIAFFGDPPSQRSFHASVVCGDSIYIHGGLDKSSKVLSSIHQFDTNSKTWTRIETVLSRERKASAILPILDAAEAPSLSHHCALNYQNKYIIFIGGWNGKKRTSDVFVFDLIEQCWNKMRVMGDKPVGLSSHTATFISGNQILIIGREGGVHTHRRSGDSFTLNPKSGKFMQGDYAVDSRSGHASCLVKSIDGKGFRLFVYGGRKTGHQYSFIGFWSLRYNNINAISEDFSRGIDTLVQNCQRTAIPQGRQNSRALCINNKIVLIYGGQVWQARDFISSDVIAFNIKDISWHRLQHASPLPKLTGFSLDIGNDGQCYVFGGNDGRTSNNIIWNLQISV